jgi:hypothetical protein
MEPDRLEHLDRAVAVQASGLPPELEIALDRASDFAKAEKAANTRRAYTAEFAAFRAWCAGRGVSYGSETSIGGHRKASKGPSAAGRARPARPVDPAQRGGPQSTAPTGA